MHFDILRTPHLSSLVLDDLEHKITMEHTQVQNNTEEEIKIASLRQVIHRTSGILFANLTSVHLKIQEYDISMVTKLGKYHKASLACQKPYRRLTHKKPESHQPYRD